jgi:hypothetical protein
MCLVGAGVVVVVVVVVVGVPEAAGSLVVLWAVGAADTAGWVLVGRRGGNVVVGVLVVGVVLGALGRAALPVSVCGTEAGEPLGTEAGVADDAFPDEGSTGMGGAVPVIGNGFVYPLAAIASGGFDGESGPRTTATTIPTMPMTEVAPTTFCRRRTFVFCRRRVFIFCRRRRFISHPNALLY